MKNIIRNRKPSASSKFLDLVKKNQKYLIIFGVVIVLFLVIFLPIYFTVINKSSNSNTGSIIPAPTQKPLPTPTPAPTPAPEPPVPGQIVSVPEWGGWATTTVDSETPIWPDTPTSFDLRKIASKGDGKKIGSIKVGATGEVIDVIGTMGTAVPWAILASIFGWKTREEMVATIIDSCNGKNNVPCCIIVQPINKYPTEIASTTSTNSKFNMINNLCTTKCTNINDPNIVATYNKGSKFPAYLLVPFQGCGGDCSKEFPDCFNSCADNQKLVNNLNYYTSCNPKPSPGAGCQQIKWMSDNNWNMSASIEQQFYNNNNATFAVSELTKNGTNINSAIASSKNPGHINYCSGKNMHFDVQRWSNYTNVNPYWCDLLVNNMADLDNSIALPSPAGVDSQGNTIRGGNVSNTMVRYMLVPGSIFGAFDIMATGGSYIPPKYPLPTPACGSGGGGGGGSTNRCGDGKTWDNLCPNPTCLLNSDCPPNLPNCYGNIKC